MRKSRTILACLLAAVVVQVARADELTEAKRADIGRLLEATGSSGIAKQFGVAMSRAMFDMMKSSRPDFPETALAIMEQETVAVFSERLDEPDGLLALTVPIYHRYFTHQEVRDLLAFYATPVGKKTVTVMPRLVQESMAVGQAWGQSLGTEIERRIVAALRKEGLLPE
jgi:hypothetical protein